MVRYAYKKSPFLKKRLFDANVDPADIRSLRDIIKLPMITKDDVRQAQQESPPYGGLLAVNSKIARIYTTTGTTGTPTRFCLTYNDLERASNSAAKGFWSCGIRPEDTVQIISNIGGAYVGTQNLDTMLRIGCCTIAAGVGNTKRQLDLIRNGGTTCLISPAWYSLYLAKVATEEHLFDPLDSKVRKIITSFEPVPPSTKKRMSEAWNAKVREVYGLSDVHMLQSAECDEVAGLHEIFDWTMIEIVDPKTGEWLDEGEAGEIVVTNLYREGTPLLRFNTKDIAKWIDLKGKCNCGRTSARHSSILGRSDSMIKIKAANVWPAAIEGVLNKHSELNGEYQIVVDRVEDLDVLKVIVELRKDTDPSGQLRSAIVQEIKETVNVTADLVELVPDGSLQTTEFKSKRVVDLRKPI